MNSGRSDRETYRGVPIHNFQPRERIEARVKPQIDLVLNLSDLGELFRYCGDISCPPEARLLAGAMLEAIFSQAATERRVRPDINLEMVRAMTAGLDEGSQWRSPWTYGCLADDGQNSGGAKPEAREDPLTDAQINSRRAMR